MSPSTVNDETLLDRIGESIQDIREWTASDAAGANTGGPGAPKTSPAPPDPSPAGDPGMSRVLSGTASPESA